MRRAIILLGSIAAMLVGPAIAAPRISVKSTTFNVSGESGAAVMRDLDRHGPKHGFMSRAIAQTRYEMNSEAEWTHRNGFCAVTKPMVSLAITYIYPKLTGKTSPQLRQRWAAFMAGVTRHEETHGRIAREMAVAAERALGKLRVRDDKACRRFGGEMKRTVNAVVEQYEKRQVRFDADEHSDGSTIARLIRRFVQ